jgi:hypothetical protein
MRNSLHLKEIKRIQFVSAYENRNHFLFSYTVFALGIVSIFSARNIFTARRCIILVEPDTYRNRDLAPKLMTSIGVLLKISETVTVTYFSHSKL